MKRASILLCVLFLLTVSATRAQEVTTINWSNFSFDPATQDAILFRDMAGVALSQGTGNLNSDGMLVQLGYYSAATAGNNFAGTWIPLTGFGAAPRTSVGDSALNPGSGGSGNGVVDFNTFFNLNTNLVRVYDIGDTGTYVTQSSITITASQPPNNQILAIRFYDSADGTTGSYNAVSADDWTWQTPTTAGPSINLSVESAFLAGTAALEFEMGGPNASRTVIPVPEPSTYALLLAGLAAVVYMRRRGTARA